jgi:hypothetical protein
MQLNGRNLRVGLFGDDVAVLQRTLLQLDYLVPEEELAAAAFGPGTLQAVVALQRSHRLAINGEVDDSVVSRINTELAARQQQKYLVTGRIRQASGAPVADVVVRAFDRDLRDEQPLGENQTGADGSYRIEYEAGQFRRREKLRADLRVAAFDREGKELATSAVVMNAAAHAIVDLTLGREAFRGPSEYERIVADVQPVIGDTSIADLTEDARHQDISFLAAETGHNAEYLAYLIQGHRLFVETKIRPEAF